MSLPSVPVPNSEPSSPAREDQPRCRKRTFHTAPEGPTKARLDGPSGATSCAPQGVEMKGCKCEHNVITGAELDS